MLRNLPQKSLLGKLNCVGITTFAGKNWPLSNFVAMKFQETKP
eukprot:SAG31_NODE_2062_length_6536_cov_8.777691_11_plen_43_part_00